MVFPEKEDHQEDQEAKDLGVIKVNAVTMGFLVNLDCLDHRVRKGHLDLKI